MKPSLYKSRRTLSRRESSYRIHIRPQPLRVKKKVRHHCPDERSRRRKLHKDDVSRNFELLANVCKISKLNGIKIDSAVFRLHTKTTVVLLVTFSFIVTTRQYVGNPIDCIHKRDIPEDTLNTFCWIHSTFTLMNTTKIVHNLPGIQTTGKHPIRQLKYYQWIAFFLTLQASHRIIQELFRERRFPESLRRNVLSLNNRVNIISYTYEFIRCRTAILLLQKVGSYMYYWEKKA